MNKYRSGFEKEFASNLKRRRIKFKFEPESLEYTLVKKYVPDFVVHTKSGRKLYIETKGRLTQDDRRKLIAVKRQHPDKDVRIIFQRSTEKLRKGSPTTYAMWAERYGFTYADAKLPKEWLDE